MDEIARFERNVAQLNRKTKIEMFLGSLSNNAALYYYYTIEQYIAALETTTTLMDLKVVLNTYEPTHQNNRRIVEPLCRCLANLHRQNEHHPLRQLTLQSADHDHPPVQGMFEVMEQFLIAAKQSGIRHLRFQSVDYLPIQFLIEFCHDNTKLKFLDIWGVTFLEGRAAMSLPPNRPQDSSVSMLVLDKLILDDVSFQSSTAATAFSNFIAHVAVPVLVLGEVCSNVNHDDEVIERILSEIKLPSVAHLTLKETCGIIHCQGALYAGTTSVTELDVTLFMRCSESDNAPRLELLADFISKAVQLNSLTIQPCLWWDLRPAPPSLELFPALEACATVTRIRMKDDEHLQDIATRNKELARFVSSPSIYPTDHLPLLMCQFDKCPTGRYMLARCLPEILAFDQIKSTGSPAEPKDKKRKLA